MRFIREIWETPQSQRDADELAWWRHFATRFMPADRPKVGEALLGYQMIVCVRSGMTGELVPWSEVR